MAKSLAQLRSEKRKASKRARELRSEADNLFTFWQKEIEKGGPQQARGKRLYKSRAKQRDNQNAKLIKISKKIGKKKKGGR